MDDNSKSKNQPDSSKPIATPNTNPPPTSAQASDVAKTSSSSPSAKSAKPKPKAKTKQNIKPKTKAKAKTARSKKTSTTASLKDKMSNFRPNFDSTKAKKVFSKVPKVSTKKIKGNFDSLNKQLSSKISSAKGDFSKKKSKFSKFKPYFQVARLDKPTGALLLLLPVFFGMALALGADALTAKYWYLWIIFTVGAFALRAAGCIWNDIIDKNYDKKVERTKSRPLASGAVDIKQAMFLLLLCLIIGFITLLFLNRTAQVLAIVILPLVALYPFTKRFTHLAQFFLGIVFNWGVWIGWFSVAVTDGGQDILAQRGFFSGYVAPLFLYLGAIFWTVGYDTIYSLQDVNHDIKLGLKSMAIKVRGHEKKFITISYLIFWILSFIAISLATTSLAYMIIVFVPLIHLMCQARCLNIKDAKSLERTFRSNTLLGVLLLYSILIAVL